MSHDDEADKRNRLFEYIFESTMEDEHEDGTYSNTPAGTLKLVTTKNGNLTKVNPKTSNMEQKTSLEPRNNFHLSPIKSYESSSSDCRLYQYASWSFVTSISFRKTLTVLSYGKSLKSFATSSNLGKFN